MVINRGFSARRYFAYAFILLGVLVTSFLPGSVFATSPMPGQIVFVSNRTGNYEIYKKVLVTGVITNLTNNPADDMNAQVSTDGQHVVFYSDRSGNPQIYKFDLSNPANVTRLTHDGADDYDPVFMPDGRVLFKSDKADGLGDIWIMNADGSNPKNLTPSMRKTEEWKPDPISNTQIIFTSRARLGGTNTDELYTLNILTGVYTRITNNKVPDWFPDTNAAGTKIAFISKEKPRDSDSIYTMDLSGNNRLQLINPNKFRGDCDDPSWSPDSQYITFVNSGKGTYDVYVVDSTGANIQPLEVNSSGDELSPMFVPGS